MTQIATPYPRAAWLSREAKAEWRPIVPELERLNLVTPEDRATLSA